MTLISAKRLSLIASWILSEHGLECSCRIVTSDLNLAQRLQDIKFSSGGKKEGHQKVTGFLGLISYRWTCHTFPILVCTQL